MKINDNALEPLNGLLIALLDFFLDPVGSKFFDAAAAKHSDSNVSELSP